MSDRIIHVTAKDFDEAVKKDGLCLVDFWANWCGPCKMLAPVLEEYVASHDDVTVLKVDVDEEEELARKFGLAAGGFLYAVKENLPWYSVVPVENGEKVEDSPYLSDK